MALDATNRAQTLAQIIRDAAWPGLMKADVQAAIGAIDDFLDANAATINAAFPQPFRGAATAQEKALIVAYVAMRRAGVLHVEGE